MSSSDRPVIPPCPDCGGQRIGNLLVTGFSGYPGLRPRIKPYRRRPISRTAVIACLGCGRLALYAEDVTELRQEASKHPDQFWW